MTLRCFECGESDAEYYKYDRLNLAESLFLCKKCAMFKLLEGVDLKKFKDTRIVKLQDENKNI